MSMDKFRDTYRDEAVELLTGLESTLLTLEEHPDKSLVDSVFRTIHTIKGSSAMFGFDGISLFTHRIETLLEALRSGGKYPGNEAISCILSCRDLMLSCLSRTEDLAFTGTGTASPEDAAARGLLDALEKALAPEIGELPGETPRPIRREDVPPSDDVVLDKPGQKARPETASGESLFRISLRPKSDIFANGTNPLALLRSLSEAGDFTCIASESVPPLSQLEPESCYLKWEILLTTALSLDSIKEYFLFFDDRTEVKIEPVADLSAVIEHPEYKRLGAILIERGASSPEQIEKAAGRQRRLGEILVEEGVPKTDITAAVEEQEHIRRLRDKFQHEASTSSVRVSSEKLDQLVDLVGELVTVQARLSQTAGSVQLPLLSLVSEQLERLTAEIRDSAMSMRMMPIGTTFSRFKRLVRDLSQELGKIVDLVMEGGDTELDKTVIEKLSDPLVHLIRNCIDHGIELPDVRKAAGKPAEGIVRLSAYQSGASVFVSVGDDGRGLDPEKIRGAAVRKGLIAQEAQLSEQEMLKLIFLPGFSTAEKVTSVSGRGVGMDVVKKNIESLGGAITVKSEPGRGMAITLKLPLTLAIIEGLLVDISGNLFVIPLANVEECLQFTGDRRNGRRILNNRGEMLPYIDVTEMFGMPGSQGGYPQVVVVDSGSGKTGILVDHVLGNHQTVIKNLGSMYRSVEGVSGATILGDGSVALIMDIQKLSALALREERVYAGT